MHIYNIYLYIGSNNTRRLTCEICASFTPSMTNPDSLSNSHTSARDPSFPGRRAAASRTSASNVALAGRSGASKKCSRVCWGKIVVY